MPAALNEKAVLVGAGLLGIGAIVLLSKKSSAGKKREKGIKFASDCAEPTIGDLYEIYNEPAWREYRAELIAVESASALSDAFDRAQEYSAPEFYAFDVTNSVLKKISPNCPSWSFEAGTTGGGDALDNLFKSLHADVVREIDLSYQQQSPQLGELTIITELQGTTE